MTAMLETLAQSRASVAADSTAYFRATDVVGEPSSPPPASAAATTTTVASASTASLEAGTAARSSSGPAEVAVYVKDVAYSNASTAYSNV